MEIVLEYRSSSVMAYILYKAKKEAHPINKVQAQRILYCCYGIIMAKFNKRLTDEHPKVWLKGPVFWRAINDINKGRLTIGMAKMFLSECPEEWRYWIDKTITTFWDYTATQLNAWCVVKGSPWTKADPLDSLDDREIYNYFQQYLPIVEKRGTEGNAFW